MRYIHIFVFCVLFVAPFWVSAQSLTPGNDVNIITVPRAPEPHSEITVELNAYTIDTTGATISWFIDGVEEVRAQNLRSLTYTTKGLGETTDINALITLRAGQSIPVTHTITPSRVDVVIEAETLVPQFYQGRALPSVGSTVRAIATPHTASGASPETFTYLWKLDTTVLYSGPVTGINVAEFEVGVSRNQLLTVDVIDNNGILVASKTIGIPRVEPLILFYEENPLRGANNVALASPYILVGEETSVRAEPYYMSNDIFSSNPLIEWELNGRTIENPNADPQYITLRQTSGNGQARIGFHIRNLAELTQGVREIFTIEF